MTLRLSTTIIALCLCALPSCARPAPTSGTMEAEPLGVSLIALVANPSTFHGKRVRVVGYLHLESEGNTLSLSKADFDAAITRNAVWVDLRDAVYSRDVSDSYVIVEGTFDAENTGHMGLNSGSIKNISRLEKWRTRAEDDGTSLNRKP